MSLANRTFLVAELRSSVERLAKSGRDQIEWVEQTGVQPDELALLFDDAIRPAVDNFGHEFTPDLLLQLELLDEQLSAMSGASNSELWTADAVLNDPEWTRVRKLANAALNTEGWPAT